MFFCHILDDFFLQSAFLVNGKQKGWWEKVAPDPKYKYDYIVCLFMHSASWAFMIMLPAAWYHGFNVADNFIAIFAFNVAIHLYVDDLKANQGMINLIQDQLVHIFQIVGTFILTIHWCII